MRRWSTSKKVFEYVPGACTPFMTSAIRIRPLSPFGRPVIAFSHRRAGEATRASESGRFGRDGRAGSTGTVSMLPVCGNRPYPSPAPECPEVRVVDHQAAKAHVGA